ncbi:MAG TPA: tetratricopeptide repeat protein [Chryseolinea sp.]|nr:tetratricopeptide repeat protein [Chryseolinea sp.]
MADYQAVIQQFPNHPAAQEALLPLQEALGLAGRSGEFDKSMDIIRKANPTNPGLEGLEYETAKNVYFDQQYQKAIVSLNNFLTTYPQTTKAQEARYYLAESHYRLRDYEKALALYNELANDNTFSMGSKVVSRIAEIEFKTGKYKEGIVSFHKLEKLATNKKDQYNAWSGLMETHFLLAQYDSADVYARIILEKGNINAGAQNKASLYLGKTAMARGDYETAKDEFLNTLNAARDEYGAEAKYSLAQIFAAKKEYKQSNETLMSLNTDFAAYESWVGKSYLLLADNFMAMDDIFQTRATLQSLIDNFPLQAVKDEAKRKMQLLDQQQLDKQPKVETDTTETNR